MLFSGAHVSSTFIAGFGLFTSNQSLHSIQPVAPRCLPTLQFTQTLARALLHIRAIMPLEIQIHGPK